MVLNIPPQAADELWHLVETKGFFDWTLLPFAIVQRDNIRARGGSFITKDVHGNEVSTASDPVIPEIFTGMVTERGCFPPSYIERGLPPNDDYYHNGVELVLRPAQDNITMEENLYPYVHGTRCGIWMRWRREAITSRNCCGGKMERFRDLQTRWKEGDLCNELVQNLQSIRQYMRPIDRIVCFGLGSLENDRAFLQHVVAATIRDTLQDPNEKPMRFIAQDPAYCNNCETVLRYMFGITVVEQPEGFLDVERNTFVMAVSPDASISQWTLDKTYRFGGPAALMCDTAPDDGRGEYEEDIKDFSSPHLEKWTNMCDDHGRVFYMVDDEIFEGAKEGLETFGENAIDLYWSCENMIFD
ncbi:uncharacterized protein K460DRAFT_420836 [Cucurbitaria berberidis CBS 394.84]|uniref:SRR1-like domain-containing protein n=1 Tax=Cucurbitaria berberidis CBS 394.84 TaxID=1168544 RepID=A0A9P4G8U1_9PLEO|nr:uncharacterized protein K460DRAFT_420836 [Cucurbitaria berberidis CBS 394.84]KAF1841001.1 hypothetical protein K460DRAFT_420836 [Cucurbitaria berberidis CBS 394.84]